MLRKSQPFIKLKDGKLNLEKIDISESDKPIKVVSIIGNGRTGKSTLLNCILSYLYESNTYTFNTQDSDIHCTFGLDMIYIPENNLILIDCQGLKLDDSSHDPQLLLITYLLSDCIIYNQKNLLNNDIFDTLSPLSSFINYLEDLENINKPQLYFRLGDVDLKFDPHEHLKTTLSKKTDQYQNVRDCMQILFSEINIGITNQLDRSEKRNLIDKKFYDMLSDYENNFLNVVTDIIDSTMKKPIYYNLSQWLSCIPDFIEKINGNKKINISKLDTYHLLMKSEIIDFRDSIDDCNYLPISVNATQKSYDDNIKPRIDFMNNCLILYEKKFGLVNKELFEKYYHEIKTQLETPIDAAINKIEIMATSAINELEESYQFIIYEDNILSKSTDNIKKILTKNIDAFLGKIKKCNYYYPVVEKQRIKYLNFIENCVSNLIFERERFVENKNALKSIYDTIFTNWKNIYDMLLKMDKSVIFNNIEETMKRYCFKKIDNLYSCVYSIFIKSNDFIKTLYNYDSDEHLKEFLIGTYSTRKIYTIDLKNMTTVSNYTEIHCIIEDIDALFRNMYLEFMSDENIKKIINTKAKQLKLVCDNSKLTIYNKNYVSEKLGFFHKCIGQFQDSTIMKLTNNDIRKISKLTEFNKWINKKYNNKFIIDKKEIVNMLINNKKNTELKYLYETFIIESRLVSNCICGIRVKN